MKKLYPVVLALLFASALHAQEPCEDTVYAYVHADTVYLHHDGAYYNCCALIVFQMEINDSVIDIREWETFPQGPCYCYCCFNLMVPIIGLQSGTYLIRVWDSTGTTLYGETWVTVNSRLSPSLGEPYQSPCFSEVCGDANGDHEIDILDIQYLARYLYSEGSLPMALSDPDGDGEWTQSDLIYLFHYLFEGGPPPCGGEKN